MDPRREVVRLIGERSILQGSEQTDVSPSNIPFTTITLPRANQHMYILSVS